MINLGDKKITNIFIADTKINDVYLGDVHIWPESVNSETPTPEPEKPYLYLIGDTNENGNISFTTEGIQNKTIFVQSNISWTLRKYVGFEYVKIEPQSGNGSASLLVTISEVRKPNMDEITMYDVIPEESSGLSPVRFSITYKRYVETNPKPTWEVTSNSYDEDTGYIEFSQSGGSAIINVNTSLEEWKLKLISSNYATEAGWVEDFNITPKEEIGEFTDTVNEYYYHESETLTLTVKENNTNFDKKVNMWFEPLNVPSEYSDEITTINWTVKVNAKTFVFYPSLMANIIAALYFNMEDTLTREFLNIYTVGPFYMGNKINSVRALIDKNLYDETLPIPKKVKLIFSNYESDYVTWNKNGGGNIIEIIITNMNLVISQDTNKYFSLVLQS